MSWLAGWARQARAPFTVCQLFSGVGKSGERGRAALGISMQALLKIWGGTALRGLARISLHAMLSVLVLQAEALAKVQAGRLGELRACTRKVVNVKRKATHSDDRKDAHPRGVMMLR
jgi:hypothetical protein